MMAAGANFHGETLFEAHHLHTDHHSPYNQVGMDRVDFPDEVDARDDAIMQQL
jgi:hypothetical protein